MEEIFNELNDALGGTAVYERASSSSCAFYFTYNDYRYSLAIFGDLAILTNITKQDYCKIATNNLTSEIAEVIRDGRLNNTIAYLFD